MNFSRLKWEFLPFWAFYIPIYFYWLWLALRARAFCFFTASNPLMKLGGFAGYSKYNVLCHIPAEFRPKMFFIPAFGRFEEVLENLKTHQIDFPLIIKPDKGERGFGVEKLENDVQNPQNNLENLKNYLKKYNHIDLIVQEYINYDLELGVMYYRFPENPISTVGNIDSVVQKEFLTVVGDGKSTLEMLFSQHPRSIYHLELLKKIHQENLQKIIPKEEKINLISIGNHSRGTTFLNANHLINKQLIDIFDNISKQIKGFYFGRYDLRVSSLEDLYLGKNIMIMELNGANSEPAHIYDPNMSIWSAYKHLFGHWKNLWKISKQNHKLGVPYVPLFRFLKEFRAAYSERKA